MDNQRIKEYTKDSKTSRSKKVEIVGLLTEQYQSDHDYDELIYWLFKSHYSVVQMFFEKFLIIWAYNYLRFAFEPPRTHLGIPFLGSQFVRVSADTSLPPAQPCSLSLLPR